MINNEHHTKFVKLIKYNNIRPLIKLLLTDNENLEICNINEYKNLLNYKNKIKDNKLWDCAKKISNPYEIIYLPNKKYKFNNISKYEPLSRSYFKIIEIINDFNILQSNKNLTIGCLAEGPGGFIEGIINFRKQFSNVNDKIFGITLISKDKDIPGWYKAQNFLKKNRNVKISYGEDGTGDIYNLNNIKKYASLFDTNKAYLVTADGGFDFSYNFNKQEQLSYRILFCEIVTALSIQDKNGVFICKFFDLFTNITQSFIYLLSHFYKKVHIIKPHTSRPANSEKYIVCMDFIGIDKEYLKKLYIIVNSFSIIEKNKLQIKQIFSFQNSEFNEIISKFNLEYYNIQLNIIKKTLNIINTLKNVEDIEIDNYNNDLNNHVICCYNWCKKYRVSINYNSKYIQLLNYK